MPLCMFSYIHYNELHKNVCSLTGISQPITTPAAPLDVNTLFKKLLTTGIISKVEQKQETKEPSEENPDSQVSYLPFLDFSKVCNYNFLQVLSSVIVIS